MNNQGFIPLVRLIKMALTLSDYFLILIDLYTAFITISYNTISGS